MLNKSIGQSLRDAQLGLFEVRDADFLAQCRDIAERIARIKGEVSINDIREHLKLPAHIHPSVLGGVFNRKKFQPIGYTQATHKQAHARVVRVYTLREGH